jgi:hypothetical protein
MATWNIIPFVGMGDLRFGIPRLEVRSFLGNDFQSFLKYGETRETDAYNGLGLHLYYNVNDRLEFIEAFAPCRPEYQGIQLLNQKLDAVLKQLRSIGFDARYDDEGYFFDQLGFALYVPHSSIEAVSVYRQGYYDE